MGWGVRPRRASQEFLNERGVRVACDRQEKSVLTIESEAHPHERGASVTVPVPELLRAPATAAPLTMMLLAWAAFTQTEAIWSNLTMYEGRLELSQIHPRLAEGD